MIKKITLIGSGNMASHLGSALKAANIKIHQVFSRNRTTGKKLSNRLQAEFVENIGYLTEVDLIIICVNDDNIEDISNQLPNLTTIHTSGNTSMNILKQQTSHGVLYPIQTLHKTSRIDFKKIPICIEANNPLLQQNLVKLSKLISDNVLTLDSEKRKYLHLAAVIASNFSNYCYLIAKNILEKENIDFNLLQPLIQHTAKKNLSSSPFENQTGPAKRGDKKTIQAHLSLLKNENYKKIYKLLSQNIIKEYEK